MVAVSYALSIMQRGQKKSFEGLVKKIELSNNSPLSDKSVSLMWIKYQLSVSWVSVKYWSCADRVLSDVHVSEDVADVGQNVH